mmetsp:Transcript_15525/g.18928  ORF Transcript_15525/g.18928 Transcript_15525/m.18928 type:complete len:287 (+) Transcript_15525:79-939(+)
MPPQDQKKKKKKGHSPAHQNAFAFRHNPKSKLTAKILASPVEGLCRRCHEKIEWRKKYRKYKPLTQPSKCNICMQRNITAAYHSICQSCASSEKLWNKVVIGTQEVKNDGDVSTNEESAPAICDSNNTVEEGLVRQIDDAPSTSSTPAAGKVCAICVKEPAKVDQSEKGEMEDEIQKKIALQETKLCRPLKLREQKAIERKVEREYEKRKQEAKEERRRVRGAEAAFEENINQEEETNNCTEKETEIENKNMPEEEDDDPFLKAIGGKEKLLTGEAYQKMLMEKQM